VKTHSSTTRRTIPKLLLQGVLSSLPLLASAQNQFFVFASDPQYPWTEKSDSGESESESTTKQRSAGFIMAQARAIRKFRETIAGLDNVPLFINGDITAFGHPWQRKFMTGAPMRDGYVRNFYLNLGNHDYQNNVDDCTPNHCAAGMLEMMRDAVKGYPYRFFDYSVRDNGWAIHTGSHAYSVAFDQLLAIQLQNEPTYTTKFEYHRSTTTITPSLDLLARELRWARAAGKDVILNMHKGPFTNWTSPKDARFLELMREYKDIILGIFAGHLHGSLGKTGEIEGIPIYLSGAAYRGSWLVAEYDRRFRRLQVDRVVNNAHDSREPVGFSQGELRVAAAIPDIRDYPRQGWGSWGDIAQCAPGEAITGMRLKSESYQGGGPNDDDSAVNAVRFYCGKSGGGAAHELISKEGAKGGWDSVKRCRNSRVVGFQMRIEPDQGSGDDTAMNNLRIICESGEVHEGEGQRPWGTWGPQYICPSGLVATGFVSKVEDEQRYGDDTGLNRVQLFCSDLLG